MAGVKGKSGRRSKEVEGFRHNIIDLAWNLCYKALKTDESIPQTKLEIAQMIVGRDLSRKQEHNLSRNIEYQAHLPRPSNDFIAIDTTAKPMLDDTKAIKPVPIESNGSDSKDNSNDSISNDSITNDSDNTK